MEQEGQVTDPKQHPKPILCSECGGSKRPESYKRGEYCPCCVRHD